MSNTIKRANQKHFKAAASLVTAIAALIVSLSGLATALQPYFVGLDSAAKIEAVNSLD